MNSNKTTLAVIVGVIVLLLLYLSMFTVTQGEEALELRLGKLVVNSKTNQPEAIKPGLHFKTPFINSVRYFDVRLQTLDVDSSRILTAEQKYVLVNYYAKWRINNLPLYYKRTGGQPARAQMLLEQKINDALRAAFGQRTIKEVVSAERLDIMSLLKQKANQSAEGLGITVTDVRIMAIDLPKDVQESVFSRMATQREQVATFHRAQGKAAAEAIRADADASAAVMIAQAKTAAQRVRAEGDNEAATIYAKAYNQDPKFYALYQSLQAYRDVFNNKDTIMVLKPDSEFFRYFNKLPQTK